MVLLCGLRFVGWLVVALGCCFVCCVSSRVCVCVVGRLVVMCGGCALWVIVCCMCCLCCCVVGLGFFFRELGVVVVWCV